MIVPTGTEESGIQFPGFISAFFEDTTLSPRANR